MEEHGVLLFAEANIVTYTVVGAIIGAGVGLLWGLFRLSENHLLIIRFKFQNFPQKSSSPVLLL